ncbi:hypothetical protein PIB30_025476 [Stylosanthes scabra]|uniref:Uncharacterized protein n=1 Tax=Stylosanthes scabra TaxID=79078 RepID=A0ABU6WAA1_9FABA|nr:hypothetical protein [Stylosanthes scabra]
MGIFRGEHAAYNCYYRFDKQFALTPKLSQQIFYSNFTPPPPPTSFRQPRAYLTTPPQVNDAAWYSDSGASHHVTLDSTNFIITQASTNATHKLLVDNGYTRPPSSGHN